MKLRLITLISSIREKVSIAINQRHLVDPRAMSVYLRLEKTVGCMTIAFDDATALLDNWPTDLQSEFQTTNRPVLFRWRWEMHTSQSEYMIAADAKLVWNQLGFEPSNSTVLVLLGFRQYTAGLLQHSFRFRQYHITF